MNVVLALAFEFFYFFDPFCDFLALLVDHALIIGFDDVFKFYVVERLMFAVAIRTDVVDFGIFNESVHVSKLPKRGLYFGFGDVVASSQQK